MLPFLRLIDQDFEESQKNLDQNQNRNSQELGLLNEKLSRSLDYRYHDLIAVLLNDESARNRQQALNALTRYLTAFPDDAELQKTWASTVIGTIVDPEESVRNKALEAIEEKLFLPLVQF